MEATVASYLHLFGAVTKPVLIIGSSFLIRARSVDLLLLDSRLLSMLEKSVLRLLTDNERVQRFHKDFHHELQTELQNHQAKVGTATLRLLYRHFTEYFVENFVSLNRRTHICEFVAVGD